MRSRLAALAAGSEHSLDIRISLDGWDAAGNDAVRGAGTFDRVLAAIAHLAAAGLSPVLTVTTPATAPPPRPAAPGSCSSSATPA